MPNTDKLKNGPLVLASTSPQRKKLLEQMNIAFEVRPIVCEEDLEQESDADKLVQAICRQKMAAAQTQLDPALLRERLVLCSDTVVSLDHHRLGKAADSDEAESYLRLLSDRNHQLLTGVCVSIPADPDAPGTSPRLIYRQSTSEVRFKRLSPADLRWYIATGEWQGAAGAYRIQGAGACLIESISGSYTGIVGLPIEVVYDIIAPYRES